MFRAILPRYYTAGRGRILQVGSKEDAKTSLGKACDVAELPKIRAGLSVEFSFPKHGYNDFSLSS